ncbi:MAG TPA: LptF/LptG family permease [Bryobacteraceae bacterium]|nr:LptF/LptG family permease [Bryobacteraceae bacterium]
MRILSRYVFREIVSSALLGTLLATFVIFLRGVDKYFELLVRSSAKTGTVLWLFALALPPVLPLTVPFGVLVGILIGLGRLSTDGEITAMRAAGVSSRAVIPPVLTFALLATILTATASLWLTPRAIRQSVKILNKLEAEQLTADIQPRVFEEQFPNTILYVGDVRPGPVAVWKNVFLADLTPPEERSIGMRDKAQGPRITVATEAIAVPDLPHNRIQLSLRDASTHEVNKEGIADDSFYPTGEQVLDAAPPKPLAVQPFPEMNTGELKGYSRTGANWIEARIELHRRLSLPLACIMLSLVGIPLGVSSRKGGKSSGYVTALFLAFFCYHLASIALIGMAKQHALNVEAAVWTPDAAFMIAGLILIARLERPGDRDLVGSLRGWITAGYHRLRPRFTSPEVGERGRVRWMPLVPQLLDTYVLTSFLFYFALLLASFVLMTEVYNFFDLLGDIIRNGIAMSRVFTYLFFLTPMLIYETLPISVLVAVLVTFGVLTKHNEVTAFKACGISLHRLAIPVLAMSGVFSVGLFAFDHFYIPDANRKQDALRNEIKGKPVQTYLHPERKWIFGKGSRIYYYKYFDNLESVMGNVSVFELDPKTFDLRREISAERAQWQPSLRTWIFQSGWVRQVHPTTFTRFQVMTFAELDEPPDYFLKELKQDKQMNSYELESYIGDLQQSGFDTIRLRVQLYKKFSVPLFALIMATISIPFGFLVGNRGAMAGIGVSIGIAMAYWGVGKLFEQIGNANQLPPGLAAWSPDVIFALAGTYLLLRMRS